MFRLCPSLLLFLSSLLALPTLATLNPNANITLSLQTQPSFSKDTILSNTESEKDLQTLGVNTNLSNTEQTTQEIQSRALNASLSIDNHLFSSEGREKIKNDLLNLGRNLAQIGRGVRNNILTQSLINTFRDKDTNLFLEMYRYALIDDTLSSLFSQEELLNSLNGMTNLDSTQVQEALNEVSKIASEENGFRATLKIYNNEEVTKGYAYSGVEGEWIGFNTLSNDITNPNKIINTLYHETSNKELHHSNDNYASNRGNSAESIFALKNYQGKNKNTISTLEWNQRETTRETLRGNGVLKEGNEYNTRAWSGQGSGSGERDNLTIFVHGTWFDPSTFKSDFKKAVAQTLKDDNQKNFSWSGNNDVESRKGAGKELAQMIKKEIKNLEDGEKITIIAHSHGGNVVKYASQELSKGELDRVIFLATPHRNDASFNQASLNKGGRVVNVYGSKDLIIQKFLGSGLWVFTLDFAKRTMNSATNIQINQGSRTLGTEQDGSPHSIHTKQNWKNNIDPMLRKK